MNAFLQEGLLTNKSLYKGTNFSLIKRRNKVVKLKYQRVVNYSVNTNYVVTIGGVKYGTEG